MLTVFSAGLKGSISAQDEVLLAACSSCKNEVAKYVGVQEAVKLAMYGTELCRK